MEKIITAKAPEKRSVQACGCPEGQVYFLVGGTQTNAIVIGSLLKRYEGVISAVTGHVNAHEAGAIEYTGHKVLPLPEYQGKMRADDLENYLRKFYEDESHEHMVFPGMVYISHPTSTGLSTAEKNWKKFPESAGNMRCLCIWTAPGWATAS